MAEEQKINTHYDNVILQRELLRRGIAYPSFAREVLKKACKEMFIGHEEYWVICSVINYYYNSNDQPITERVLGQRVLEYGFREKKIQTEEVGNVYIQAVHDLSTMEPDNSDGMLQSLEKYVRSILNFKAIADEMKKAMAKGDQNVPEYTVKRIQERFADNSLISITGNDDDLMDVIEGDSDQYVDLLASLWSERIPTGFKDIDRILGGGLSYGEVGVIGALYGGGKTMVMNSLARNYVLQGKNVIYIALEEKKNRMYYRFLQTLTQLSSADLFNTVTHQVNIQVLGDAINALKQKNPGRFFFYRKSPHTVSLDKLEQVISSIQLKEGLHIDVIIIDYPDLLINRRAIGDVSKDGGALYEDVRRMGQDFNSVTWVATQLNRGSMSAEVKTMEFVEGSKQKLNAVEFAATINASKEERLNGFMRLYIDKVRNPEAYVEFVNLKADGVHQTVRDYINSAEKSTHDAILENQQNETKIERKKKWAEKEQKQVVSDQNKADSINQVFNLGGGQ